MKSDGPVFYDCEASCLGGLPIEIGWAFVDVLTHEIRSEGHLIKPPLHWDLKPVWDPDAEKLHKISRQQLAADGRSPLDIGGRMNKTLAGRELFSDHPSDDERWLRIVFGEAGLEPTFTICRTPANVLIAQLIERLELSDHYEAAQSEASGIAPITHRAEADARHLAVLWNLLLLIK